MLKVFLHLRIKEVELKKDSEDIAPKKKFMTFKEKRKHLSRMQRKVMTCAFWVLITYSIVSIKKGCTYAGCPVASQDDLSKSTHQAWIVHLKGLLTGYLWDLGIQAGWKRLLCRNVCLLKINCMFSVEESRREARKRTLGSRSFGK